MPLTAHVNKDATAQVSCIT